MEDSLRVTRGFEMALCGAIATADGAIDTVTVLVPGLIAQQLTACAEAIAIRTNETVLDDDDSVDFTETLVVVPASVLGDIERLTGLSQSELMQWITGMTSSGRYGGNLQGWVPTRHQGGADGPWIGLIPSSHS